MIYNCDLNGTSMSLWRNVVLTVPIRLRDFLTVHCLNEWSTPGIHFSTHSTGCDENPDPEQTINQFIRSGVESRGRKYYAGGNILSLIQYFSKHPEI